MINRQNKKLIDQYLTELYDNDDIGPKTFKVKKTRLMLLLIFADETDFKNLPDKANGKNFKNYLRSGKARRDKRAEPISAEYFRQVLLTTRLFFEWLQDKPGYTKFRNRWVKSFSITKRGTPSSMPDGHRIYFSIDEINKIARTPISSLNEERIKAAIIFLFLTGTRIGAFLTLPIKAVDIRSRIIYKYPELGVETKFNKRSKAKIADIPILFDIVKAWDKKVRSLSPSDGKWFAPISPKTGLLNPNIPIGKHRDKGFRNDFKAFLEKAGIDIKSPHKLRHGFIRYGRDHAKHDIRSLEAIAHNTGQTLSTMLKYAKLSEEDAFEEFDIIYSNSSTNVETNQTKNNFSKEYIEQIEYLLQEMKREYEK